MLCIFSRELFIKHFLFIVLNTFSNCKHIVRVNRNPFQNIRPGVRLLNIFLSIFPHKGIIIQLHWMDMKDARNPFRGDFKGYPSFCTRPFVLSNFWTLSLLWWSFFVAAHQQVPVRSLYSSTSCRSFSYRSISYYTVVACNSCG